MLVKLLPRLVSKGFGSGEAVAELIAVISDDVWEGAFELLGEIMTTDETAEAVVKGRSVLLEAVATVLEGIEVESKRSPPP